MSETAAGENRADEREIVITRVFDAPRELVWRAFTEAEHVEKWWGPEGFSTRVEELDVRPGGKSRYVMIGPDGAEYPVEGVFRDIVPMERFVTTDEFGEDYKAKSEEDLPEGIILTAIFEEVENGKTRLTLRLAHPTAEDKRKHEEMGVVAGWQSSFACLDKHLATL